MKPDVICTAGPCKVGTHPDPAVGKITTVIPGVTEDEKVMKAKPH